MTEVPFCERNVRHWVTLLVGLGVVVLAYSIWSAGSYGLSNRLAHPGRVAMQQGDGPGKQGPGGMAHGRQAAFLPKNYVATLTGTPVAGATLIPTGPASAHPPVDAVTMATPHGGIHFVAGTQPVDHRPFANFNQAADVIRPAVVNINAIRPQVGGNAALNAQGAHFIDPFDGVPDKMIGQMAFESVGSGVIVDPQGYVVTNHHVVAGATSVVVTRFNHVDGHFSARIIASDERRDLALLQIQADGPFPAATLANSSQVEVGDWVLAVGNPFGLEHTVTSGIISGKRSSLNIAGVDYRGLLQTDAPINKGSSGGPLVDLNGQVVGINTAIYAPTGVSNGTGFAIPSSKVGAFVARYLKQPGTTVAMQQQTGVRHAGSDWMGIGVIDMTPGLASKIKYKQPGGVYVSSLVLDSPADEAEVLRGGVITSVSGLTVRDSTDLRTIVSRFQQGQKIPLLVWRKGKSTQLVLNARNSTPFGP